MRDQSETAYAKINLALHILGKRDDGYHDIDTIFAFVNDGDKLSVRASDNIKLNMSGPFAASIDCENDDNLVIKVAYKMQSHFHISNGAALSLIKNLPIASGIGGGSADAAAAARLLNRHWNLHRPMDDLAELLAPLGADIPACIYSQMCQGEGIGTNLQFIDDREFNGLSVLLVNPMIAVATGPIFTAWDGQSSGPIAQISMDSMRMLKNDMETAAKPIFPEIQMVLEAIEQTRPLLHRMSGSGATCFGLYESAQSCEDAQNLIDMRHGDWWTMIGRLK